MNSQAIATAFLLALCALAVLNGCATAEAIEAAPDEFWGTLRGIVAALVEDVLAVLDFLL